MARASGGRKAKKTGGQMKINIELINHNVIRVVEHEVTNAMEANTDKDALKSIYYIFGVLNLAEELKKVLEA